MARSRAGRQGEQMNGVDHLPRLVLLIDDQVEHDDPLVGVLELEGFRVECVDTAAAGLTRATVVSCDAIVLELNLPDCDGLILMDLLRHQGVSVPIIAVTGYCSDIEHAVAAMRRSAYDFQLKPLAGEKLAEALRTAIATNVAESPASPAVGVVAPRQSEHRILQELLRTLDSCPSGGGREPDLSWFWGSNRDGARADCRGIVAALVKAVTSPAISIPVFLACASGLSGVLKASPTTPTTQLVRQLMKTVTSACLETGPSDSRVLKAVAQLGESVRVGRHRSEEAIARDLYIDRAHLGRLIQRDTGLDFRKWRRTLSLKTAVVLLCRADMNVSQVADKLGYEHSQLTREFRETFGITPRSFRKLLAHIQPSPSPRRTLVDCSKFGG